MDNFIVFTISKLSYNENNEKGGDNMIRSLTSYISQHRTRFIIGVIFALVNSLALLVPNYIIQRFVDGLVQQTISVSKSIQLVGVLFAAGVIAYLSQLIYLRTIFYQGIQYQAELRQSMFDKLLTLRQPFYEKFRSGDLMTRMTTDIDMMGNMLSWGTIIALGDGLYMIAIIVVMSWVVSWQAALVSSLPLVLFGIAIYYIGQQVDQRYERSREEVTKLSNEVLEVVEGVRVIRSYTTTQVEQARFTERTQQARDKTNDYIVYNASYGPVSRFFSGLSTAAGLLYGGYMVKAGQITVGQFVAFQMYLGMLSDFVWGAADLVAIYKQANISFNKISELITYPDEVAVPGQVDIDQIDSIEWRDYSFTYPNDKHPILKDISLILKRGQTLGIVGKTGSGKSTLVRQMLRQFPVENTEQFLLNGRPITDYAINQIESLISYVPQEHIMFSKTVRYNIEFGLKEATEKQVMDAVDWADLSKDLARMPEGLDTIVGEKGVTLSGGQKQRISIARALIRQPELLILDDSLSAVDAQTERTIIDHIARVRQDKTNMIVSHRLSAVQSADLIIVMEQGRIVESGTSEQLMVQKGWYYEQYLRQQVEGDHHEDI
ncbi:ABC transporter ATP-binding protein [Falseniella ignava]|uniref:ABC transporter ATP-binding protein n=2 Tax=Falseniella ignava TaxID=137730 RepID=A0A2I1K4V8_9LACT|nr:ABC transporter ATP-binding protein [Falseniella ignava]